MDLIALFNLQIVPSQDILNLNELFTIFLAPVNILTVIVILINHNNSYTSFILRIPLYSRALDFRHVLSYFTAYDYVDLQEQQHQKANKEHLRTKYII